MISDVGIPKTRVNHSATMEGLIEYFCAMLTGPHIPAESGTCWPLV